YRPLETDTLSAVSVKWTVLSISNHQNLAVLVEVAAPGHDGYRAGPRLERLPVTLANQQVNRHGKLQVGQSLFRYLLKQNFAMSIEDKARFEVAIRDNAIVAAASVSAHRGHQRARSLIRLHCSAKPCSQEGHKSHRCPGYAGDDVKAVIAPEEN